MNEPQMIASQWPAHQHFPEGRENNSQIIIDITSKASLSQLLITMNEQLRCLNLHGLLCFLHVLAKLGELEKECLEIHSSTDGTAQ